MVLSHWNIREMCPAMEGTKSEILELQNLASGNTHLLLVRMIEHIRNLVGRSIDPGHILEAKNLFFSAVHTLFEIIAAFGN